MRAAERVARLRKLLALQEKVQALHVTRHAGHVAAAAAAATEAAEIAAHFEAQPAISSLFPEVYHRRIASAVARQEASEEAARQEAGHVMVATARTKLVARDFRGARADEERERGDRERLEAIAVARPRKP